MRGRPISGGSRSPRSGIGLLAVLVAIVIVSFAIIPLYTSFQGSRLGAEKSINYLIASNLITSQIEAFRARPFRELEEYLFGWRGPPRYPIDIVNGPFETKPETPDVIEKGALKTGDVVFDRYTFLAYFPSSNPRPDAPDHWLQRQRIRIRCDVLWKEPTQGGPPRDVKLTVATMVHNEGFNPKPGQRPPGGR
jgi:type II secretory pathway pseudopilin PulG